MNNQEVMLSVRNVGMRFRSRLSIYKRAYIQALRDVSFELYKGDSLGVIGRNGAGKSTLLMLLAGIIYPSQGEIINNNASTSLLALNLGFDNELSGRLNIITSGMFLGFSKKTVESKMESIIEFSELGNFIDEPVKTYSAGMRARLGFSITLILEPDILLIDEILGVGDKIFRNKSMKVMQEKILSDCTIVFTSHDANTIKSLCNRAVWIENGVTKMEGTAEEVVNSYEDFLFKNNNMGIRQAVTE